LLVARRDDTGERGHERFGDRADIFVGADRGHQDGAHLALAQVFASIPRASRPAEQQALFAEPPTVAAAMPIQTAPDLASALTTARALGSPILIAGSLFLVGEARVLLLGAPADPIALSDPSNLRK
jgi:hypothetical protein